MKQTAYVGIEYHISKLTVAVMLEGSTWGTGERCTSAHALFKQ